MKFTRQYGWRAIICLLALYVLGIGRAAAEAGWVFVGENMDISCSLTNSQAGLAIVQSYLGPFDLRFGNPSFSLPTKMMGNLTLNVSQQTFLLPILQNTSNWVDADVTGDQLRSIISAMKESSRMTIAAGSTASQNVSLSGSNKTKALAAFLKCAGI